MTPHADPERTKALYERTRALQRAVLDGDRELEEVRAKVRTALAALRRAQRSWGSRSDRPRRRSSRTRDPLAVQAGGLEAAVASLEALDRRLTGGAHGTATSWLEADTACSIPERFAQQAARRPEQPAIAGTSMPLAYSELEALADRYAGLLASRGGRRRHVALLLEHDAQIVAAALGALRGGMAVVTLNPSEPPARHAEIREAADASLLLTDELHLAQAHAAGFPDSQIVRLDAGCGDAQIVPPTARIGDSQIAELSAQSTVTRERPHTPIEPDVPAFLICTSGSTGRPKIVIQTHRTMLHNVLRYTNGLQLREDDRVAWLASLSGGQGLATALSTLLNGATLYPFPIMERGVTGLADWLVEHRITVFDTIPSVLRNFSRTLGDRRFAGIRLVRLASEPALRGDFDAFRRHFGEECALASVLASSEAGIIAQCILHAQDAPPDGRLPVGSAVEGIEVRLEGETGRSVEEGQLGEIVVQGRFMSPGYLGDEALTAKHFESIDGIRRFHTGDLARRSASGRLTVMGRADAQVKVRGHRLQLEEVEAALARQQDVSGAAAVVRFNARGDARLVAYVTMTPGSQLDAGRLRTSLAASLPPHAVPSAIVGVDAFPLTPHGKVDREQLVRTEPVVAASSELERNPSETEELLRDTWCAAFEHNGIGLDEGFLALGGDSLTAAVIAAELRELFGVELGLREFAADPTVAELAASIEERRGIPVIEPEPPLERAHRGGPVRLSFSQAAMWVSVHDKAAGFNIAVPYQLSGSLDVAALRDCLEQIVRRHEILRTVFVERDGVTVQLGQAPQLELAHDDLRAERDPLAAAERIVARDAAIPFDVGSLPPLSMRLLRVSDREHRLLLVSHHLICDALSWRVFFDELALLYEARVSGRASPLPPEPPLQYADFAIWEETVARPGSARWQSDLAWWAARFESPPPTLRLPFSLDSPEPVGRSTSVIESRFAKTLSEQLDTIAREAGATSFMGRLAAFAALLALRTGVDDFVLDTYVTARRHAALRHMIGPLINRVLLRIRFSGELTFNGWLAEVREAVLETMAHTTITFGELWRELHRQGIQRPTVRTKFEAHYRVPSKRFGDLQLEALTRHYVEPWGFTLGIECDEGADRWRAVCDPGEYDVTVVERFLGDLEKLVRAACTQPDRPLRELEAGLVVGVDALG